VTGLIWVSSVGEQRHLEGTGNKIMYWGIKFWIQAWNFVPRYLCFYTYLGKKFVHNQVLNSIHMYVSTFNQALNFITKSCANKKWKIRCVCNFFIEILYVGTYINWYEIMYLSIK
jgi:hypothetical protein